MTITLDYSDAFYRTELALKSATGEQVPSLLAPDGSSADNGSDDEVPDSARVLEIMSVVSPDEVDFSRKQATT